MTDTSLACVLFHEANVAVRTLMKDVRTNEELQALIGKLNEIRYVLCNPLLLSSLLSLFLTVGMSEAMKFVAISSKSLWY